MEYIGETGRQLKIRMKEYETDSKVDFLKKSGKKKKDKLSGLLEHLKKKNINQIGVRLRFWQKKIIIGNADQKTRISSLNTRKRHHF